MSDEPYKLKELSPGPTFETLFSRVSHAFGGTGSLKRRLFRAQRIPERSRAYQPGDPVRFIDWRSYARTDQLQINLISEEAPARVSLYIQQSKSMLWPPKDHPLFKGKIQKIETALRVAFALAYIHLKNSDMISLFFITEQGFRRMNFSSPTKLVESFFECERTGFDLNVFDGGTQIEQIPDGADISYVLSDYLPGDRDNQWNFENNLDSTKPVMHLQILHSLELDLSWLKGDVSATESLHGGKEFLGDELKTGNFYQNELQKWIVATSHHLSRMGGFFESLHEEVPASELIHALHAFSGS